MLPIVHPSSAKTKGNSRKNKAIVAERALVVPIGLIEKTLSEFEWTNA